MKSNIKVLKQKALKGDLSALEELRQLGVLSRNNSKYTIAPVSYAQRRLWFIDKMDSSPAYNLPAALILDGHLNINSLEKAIDEIINRHEILRTVFVETDGVPYQKIFDKIDFKLVKENLNNSADINKAMSDLINEELNRNFNLSKAPLIIFRLFGMSDEKHLLLFNMHHIISDGWSIEIIINELTLLYNTFVKGEVNPLVPLKTQYKDFVIKHEQILNNPDSSIHKNYWINKLSGELPVTELQSDFKRPLYKTFNGNLYQIIIEKKMFSRIILLCRKNQVSLFMLLVSALNILINKYSGNRDIIIGSPVSGREQRNLENQIGFYVNTVPLRNNIDPDISFTSFLGIVKEHCIEAYDHQIYPFDLLIDDLKVERDTSRNPLFEIIVSSQKSTSGLINFESIKTSIHDPIIKYSKFDLNFNFEENTDEISLGIVYNSDLYCYETIQRMGDNLISLLQNILNNPDEIIKKIDIISLGEKDRIVTEFNDTQRPFPKDKTIAELFELIEAEYPDKPAVVYQGKPISYKSLNNRANYFAYQLINKYELQLEEPVAILMDRSVELIIAILGVLKAGGAYLPVDVNMPEDRINFIMNDVNARIIITDIDKEESDLKAEHFIKISNNIFPENENYPNLIIGKTSSNLAYILYTSGSTGMPKGSLIEDKSVVRLVRNSNYVELNDSDKLLSTSSISFDAFTFDSWGMLLNGGTLYLENTDDYLDPDKLKKYITDYKINIMLIPTGLYERIAEVDLQNNLDIFIGVTKIIVGGDRLPFEISNKFITRYANLQLINGYGPTENTTFTTFYNVKKEFKTDIPIGKPITNTSVYIFNESGNLCPIGVSGEIYIGGEGLSRGYINRYELNKQKFVKNPLNQSETLYRSGDIGKWDCNGNILFLGRNDDQLKIRGYRIETGEIEKITSTYENIINTKILVVEEDDQKELVLYFTATNDISIEELKKYLRSKLPEYMLPKYYIRLEEFPLNQNGKIDYRTFPKPDKSFGLNENKSQHLNSTEITLINIFEEILNIKNISVDDNFFRMGGHSLKAIRVVSAIQKQLSIKITIKEFFSSPEIASLQKLLKSKKREELGVIPVIDVSEYYNLSHAQKRLWVLNKIEKSKSTYNIPLAISIKDKINFEALQSAFDDLVSKHESLRTVFIEIDGEPFQKVIYNIKIPLVLKDFCSESDPESAAFNFVVSASHTVFSLSEYPLVRLYVIKTSDEDYILLLNIHHIICDGWSIKIIIDELFEGYRNYIEKSENRYSILKIQYKDYAYWLNKRLTESEHDSDSVYWLKKFDGELTSLDLPLDYHRPSVKTYDGSSIYYSFPEGLKKELDKFNLERRSSLFMTLLASIKILLYKYTGSKDIIIGTPVVGRNHPDLEDQIGFYVNTLALRDSINPDKSFVEFLEDIKITATDSYSHQMYPFDKLIEDIKLPRDTSRSPLFDIMVVFQNFDVSLKGVFKEITAYPIPMDISKFDLTFNFNDRGEKLDLLIEYNTQLFKKERIDLIASHLFVLLKAVITNSSRRIREINIISRDEENILMKNFNDTSANYPDDKTIISLFEESTAKYPSNEAVVYKEKILTYSDLNYQANLVARHLLKNYSISPGDPVCVLMPPSENTIIILLAILKTGGAYVPIDPEYPDERIKQILSESKTKIIITQSESIILLYKLVDEIGLVSNIIDIPDLIKSCGSDGTNISAAQSNPDTAAYIIFTSGSTGKPKGCIISHRNLVRLFINDKSHYDFSSADVWIMAHSYCFDLSVWEMYGALLFGGKIIIPDRNEVRDISAFVNLVDHHKVTILNQTPGAFYKFIDTVLDNPGNISLNLRYVIFGGEKLNPSKLVKWVNVYTANKVKLINMYGITETTIHVTFHRLTDEEIITSDGRSNVGKPLPETKVYIFNNCKMLVPIGVYGEMYIGGTGLSKGYLNRPDLTAERFIPNPYDRDEILYKSGDIARWNLDGTIEYLERCDNQVQIRGYRVEINEIELQLNKYNGITATAVVSVEREGTNELAAYIVSDQELKVNNLKNFLSLTLPDYMIPSFFIKIEKIPLTPNGKLDKKSLPPAIQNIATGAIFANPVNRLETELLILWQEVLTTENISIYDNFFDIGGNSILLVKLHSKINSIYPDLLELTDLFSKSRISEQAEFISNKINPAHDLNPKIIEARITKSINHDVAIIGIAAIIGDCETPDDFWKSLRIGEDFIGEIPESRIPDIKELSRFHGIDIDKLKFRENCYLNEIDKFDYGFFKMSPNEASLIDPGQRLFIETAYHAIEDAGYGGNKLWGSKTGVFIGASDNLGEYSKYIEASENQDPNLLLAALTPSILASRLSYHLNLKGPALLVDTACSSSLVAVHLACQSIREGKIDSAIVGGIKLHLLPIDSGLRLEISSSDSRAHSFDDSASGTGSGEGIIAIFIKPLEKAVHDRDNIYAIIKGSEINQDGSSIGITAPDANAQADAIEKAWLDSGIDPLSISYIETHGTATKLGDPIEIDGINKAFGRYTSKRKICAIGALKANIGHLDTAAGIASLLKAVLCLKYKQLTPLVHFKTPNRNINFEESAAYINKDLKDWERNGNPLRCGISSFGLSGTNCHVVLEEAPQKEKVIEKGIKKYLFTLSARNKAGLIEYVRKVKKTLYQQPDSDIKNICYTLSTGRGHFSHRLAIAAENINELRNKLSQFIENDCRSDEAESVFYNYFKIVASNKKNLSPGEITESDLHELSKEINTYLKNNKENSESIYTLAKAYTNGADILWEDFYSQASPSRISLPGYPFEKNRCWVQVNSKVKQHSNFNAVYGKNYDNHFLNNCLIDSPTIALYKNTYSEDNWLLNDHRVMGLPTLVGSAYLQIAYESGKNHLNNSQLRVDNFFLLQPLSISIGENREVLTTVNKSEDDKLKIEIYSKQDENDWLIYAKMEVSEIENKYEDKIDLGEIIKNCPHSRVIIQSEVEKKNEKIIKVSRKWDCLNKIYWNEKEYLAELSVPESDTVLANKYYLYPPLIDAAISYAIDEEGFLPYSFGTVRLYKKIIGKIFSYISKTGSSLETRSFDVTLTDDSGEILAVFIGFTLKKIIQSGQNNYFHELIWKLQPLNKIETIQNNNGTLVLYNSDCNPSLLFQLKSVQGLNLSEIIEDNFDQIFEEFDEINPTKVLFLLPESAGVKINSNDLEDRLKKSLYSAFNFAKYLSRKMSAKADLLFAGKNVCQVSTRESNLNSLLNSVAGLGQVLQREMPNIRSRFLDIDDYTTVSEILEELNEGFTESFYYRALREGKRFIREFKPVKLENRENRKNTFREGGVYLITGGTGGIGLEIALFLAKQSKIKLALLNHSLFPAKSEWDSLLNERKNEKLCKKIERLFEIEDTAEEVKLYYADVNNYKQLKLTIENIENDFGKINGVIHAAGIPGEGFIYGKTMETFSNVIKPKIHGTIYLSELLKDNILDFFVMTSALTAILPTSGQSDYTAANSFMDAFSYELNNSGYNAMSINLTSWKETGMAYDFHAVDDGIFKSISTENGINALRKLLKRNIPSIIVGEPDLTLLDSNAGLPFYLDMKIVLPKKSNMKAKSETELKKAVILLGKKEGCYSGYEIVIARVWGNVLGYLEINVSDNYYDLGGDSIHAIKIINLLEKELKQQVTISDLFNNLTVSDLAAFLELRTRSENTGFNEHKSSSMILPAEKKEYYAVSAAQRRLYILDKLTKDKLNYHIPAVWNIKGNLDINLLKDAFNKIIKRHDILRTSFILYDDQPVQVINENIEFVIPYLKMNENEARQHIHDFIKPFELERAPLFRVEIIELETDNHLILFDSHHIIIDAFSLEVLKKEIFDYYEGNDLEPLKIQYKDYSEWQRKFYGNQKTINSKAYWISQFEGEIPIIDLPLDYPRQADQPSEAGILSFCIDEELTSEVKKISAANGISTFMILLAVYNIVLHKYTQQEDIIIGVTTLGRDNEEISNLPGMFVNNLPIRTFPKYNLRVLEFLLQVKNTVINAFSNQDYPFDELIEDLNIKRDLTRSPLFDVVFSYMNFELTDIKNNKLYISDYKAETVISSEYDLMLYGLEAQDKIFITVKYKKSLFSKNSITRFTDHFRNILEAVTENREIKLSDIELFSSKDAELVKEFNNHYKKITKKTDVIDFLKCSFEKNTELTALLNKDQKITYGQLNEKANRIANYLRLELQVKPNDLIGIMIERNESMIAAMLGVMKSGAAYIGIDPDYPQKRIEYILNDSHTKIILTEKSVIQKNIIQLSEGTFVVEIDNDIISKQNPYEPVIINMPENTAYIIYTSGSTGDPKGVEITHKNLSIFLQWCAAEFKKSVIDIVYATTSYCFDMSIFEIFYSLVSGKTIRILKSALDIPTYLDHEKNVLLNTVPSLFTAIINDLSEGALNNISVINLGGENIPQTLIDSIDCDRIEIRNLYGPSEDTTYSTMYKFSNKEKKVLIGRPISNTQIYIIDRNLKLIPMGHTGEICISGDGLARGYLFKNELTKEKFIDNPFGKGRLYRTGDLGRWTETGDIELLGRIDRQVKIRGYRIELGEIETNISRYPSVSSNVVTANSNGSSKEIAAYIVAKEKINVNNLKDFLLNVMPEFMIPTYFIMIEKIPLTLNGKIDIKTLPDPVSGIKYAESSVEEIFNPTETAIAEIWKEILNIDKLSKYDDFFNIGGHSLKALVLLSKINRIFKSNCLLSDIFEYPTINQFSSFIIKQNSSQIKTLVPLPKSEYYEVSHAQRRLWILDRIDKNSIAYNIPIIYSISASVNIETLQKAFNAIIQKYESFRTYFIEIDGEPKQGIVDNVDFKIDILEVNENHDFAEESKKMIQKAITTPFNLAIAPLIKVTLLKSKSEELILIINVHHIILDEWSINILAENLYKFYDHFSGKCEITDKSFFNYSDIQYKEYAHWHNQQFVENEAGINIHKEYWLEMFKEPVLYLNLPSDFQRPLNQTFEGRTESFELSNNLTKKLRIICAENSTTLFITTLTLINILFSKYTNQNDIVIGTPIANRDHIDVQDQIGFFLNTLALRNLSDNEESFKTFLNKVKNKTVEALSHQLYSFDLLIDELEIPRDLSRSPLFNVMLISQTPASLIDKTSHGLELKSSDFDYPVSKYDLSISYYDNNNSIKYFFEYNTALFEKERIANMFDHFSSLIESIYENRDEKISKLNIVSSREKEKLYKLSFGDRRTLSNKSIVSLIEKQVAVHKDNFAIVFKRTKLTFEEVNSKANQLANYLIQSEGINPGDIICAMLDRTEWSVISLLAILKTGGVYAPVDPDYPQNRIDYILHDSGAKVLITCEKYEKNNSFDKNKIITIKNIRERISHFSICNPDIDISADTNSTAYIIYTSGSTGQPKGVLGTHKCLLNLIEDLSLTIESGLKTLQFAPHSFDVSIQEILFSLASGGTLYLIENEMRYKMTLIAGLIEKEGIEILTMLYSTINLFLGELDNYNQLKSIKHFITSGEQPFINQAIEKLLRTYPDIKFHNQYGPSETHVVTTYTLSGKDDLLPAKIPTGRPIANTQIFVLDQEMNFHPTGIPGDLFIGGYNVANGYVNKPEYTIERFIDNPLGDALLFKSGDLARWDYQGNLEFMGRNDSQVKVRGFRIEPGEIESCMLMYPDLKETVVKLSDDGDNKELVAYFSTEKQIDISKLKEYLTACLPAYMIPGYFVKLDSFPHTANGKIDLLKLPKPDENSNSFLSDFIEPEGKTEIIIASVWKEILKKDKISSKDNFFEIGGNSIRAIQVMSKIQKKLGKKTFLDLIFKYPTIKQMADIILDMDQKLKSIDANYVLLNEEHEKKVFFLPPGIGYSFAYTEFAKYFDTISIYGLNFIESSNPARSTAELIIDLQQEGKIFLFGHSAGGNMAYDVALELKEMGRKVGGILLLDSYRQLELIQWNEEEYLNDAVLYIEQNHAEFLDEEIKESTLRKIVSYRKYLNSRKEDKSIDCPIYQIEAEDLITNFDQNISRSAWCQLTTQFELFAGFGSHMDMLKKPNIEKNALLADKLLVTLINKW